MGSKSIVLKNIVFTEALTDAFEAFWGLVCQRDEGSKFVYVSNGYICVKLDLGEYDRFIRPLTGRDAGNFTVSEDHAHKEIPDLRETFEKYISDPGEVLTAMPYTFDLDGGWSLTTYYGQKNDFVTCVDTRLAAAIAVGVTRRARDSRSGVICYRGTVSKSGRTMDPVAVIMPMRMTEDSYPARKTRAWFSQEGGLEKEEYP